MLASLQILQSRCALEIGLLCVSAKGLRLIEKCQRDVLERKVIQIVSVCVLMVSVKDETNLQLSGGLAAYECDTVRVSASVYATLCSVGGFIKLTQAWFTCLQ